MQLCIDVQNSRLDYVCQLQVVCILATNCCWLVYLYAAIPDSRSVQAPAHTDKLTMEDFVTRHNKCLQRTVKHSSAQHSISSTALGIRRAVQDQLLSAGLACCGCYLQ